MTETAKLLSRIVYSVFCGAVLSILITNIGSVELGAIVERGVILALLLFIVSK